MDSFKLNDDGSVLKWDYGRVSVEPTGYGRMGAHIVIIDEDKNEKLVIISEFSTNKVKYLREPLCVVDS